MSHLAGGDIFEDDLSLFLLAELLIKHTLVLHGACVQIGEILVFPVDARSEHGYLNIERFDVFLKPAHLSFNRPPACGYGRSRLGLDASLLTA